MVKTGTYLITLATGRQGASTCACLLKHGNTVHALVRDKNSQHAKDLEKLGCKIFQGDLDEPSTITPAIEGCQGIFLNVFPAQRDPNVNIRQAHVFIEAATKAKLTTVVVSTALHTDKHAEWRVSQPDYPLNWYYGTKFGIEEAVRNSTIKYKIFLRPGWLMHNYLEPLCNTHFPRYQSDHILDVAYEKGAKVGHFDAHDVGKFAGAALMWPNKWDGQVVELVSELLDIESVAATISKGTGIKVEAKHLSDSEASKLKGKAGALPISKWCAKSGMYLADPSKLEKYALTLTSFEEWVGREKDALKKVLS